MPESVVDARAAATGGTATFTLDRVNLTLSSPMLPDSTFVTSEPGSASQVASASVVRPYREVIVTAIPFGTSPGTEKLPDAHAGDQQSYRSSLVSDRSSQGGHPAPGPAASLFGQNVASVVSILDLHLDGPQLEPTAVVEWVAQAGPRMWILRISQEVTPGDSASQLVDALTGVALVSSDPNHPSSLVPSPSPSSQPTPSGEPSPAVPQPSPTNGPTATPASTPVPAVTQAFVRQAAPVTASAQNLASTPPWWNGTCDSNDNRGSYPLGSSYDGVISCGPLPIDGGTDYLVQFYAGAWGEYEWECVELVMRYLYLVDGVLPYSANGSQVVWNYTGSALTQVGNGTVGEAPVAGDVLSYGSTSTAGHASVVSSASVDSAGDGTITVIEDNNTTGGTTTMAVSNWVVQGSPYPVSGWLQVTTASTAGHQKEWAATNSNGALEVFLRGGDGEFWTDYQTQPGNNAGWSGWYPMGGSWPGEPAVVLDGQGRLELFARGGDGQLWHAYETQAGNPASWSGFSALGGYSPKDPVATVLANGAIEVYEVGGDTSVWHDYETTSGNEQSWSGWYALGGFTPGQPAPIVESNGAVDLFVRGTDGSLWHDYQTAAGNEQSWSGWYWLGGVSPGQPAPALESNGGVDLFVRGADGSLWHKYQTVAGNDQSWSGWSYLAGYSPLDPVVGRNSDGRLELLVIGGDGELWHNYETAAGNSTGWSGWYPLGGSWPSPPALGVGATKGLQVFLVGGDGGLWFSYQTAAASSTSWSGFYSLDGAWPSP